MVRTQVYLPEEIHRELLIRKKKEGISIAEQIRRALELYLKADEIPILKEDDPIWNIVGRVETGDGDLSEKHDRYLYGKGR